MSFVLRAEYLDEPDLVIFRAIRICENATKKDTSISAESTR